MALRLKARDIERLENTSFASALAPAATPAAGGDACGPCTWFTVCAEGTQVVTNCCECTACTVGTVCTFTGSCCTDVTDIAPAARLAEE